MGKARRFFRAALVLLLLAPCVAAPAEGGVAGSFDLATALARVDELSSPAYAGRLVGSPGNRAALDYVAAEFGRLGLQPLPGRDGFFLPFRARLALAASEPRLEVYEGERLLRSYRRFADFRETYLGRARPGEIRGAAASWRAGEPFPTAGLPILLYSAGPPEALDEELLLGRGFRGLILQADEASVSRKGGSLGYHRFEGAEGFVKFIVGPRVFSELLDHAAAGREFRLDADFTTPWIETANLAAYLPASRPRLGRLQLVSAHLDHLGTEAGGSYYPGALDNASGIALLLGMAEALAARRGELETDLVFLAFNAEEEGLYGSRAFVEAPPLPLEGAELLNLDSLGGRSATVLLLLSFSPRAALGAENPLVRPLEARIERLAAGSGLLVHEERASQSSDHLPFALRSLPALSLSEDPLGPYHTFADLPEGLDPERLGTIGNLVLDYLEELVLSSPGEARPDSARLGLPILLLGLGLLVAGGLLLRRRRPGRASAG